MVDEEGFRLRGLWWDDCLPGDGSGQYLECRWSGRGRREAGLTAIMLRFACLSVEDSCYLTMAAGTGVFVTEDELVRMVWSWKS